MRIKHSLLVLGLAALAAAPMTAQEKPNSISVGVDYLASLDGLKTVTNNNSGYGLTVGYNTFVYGTTVPLRLSGSYYIMPGSTDEFATKVSLTNYQVSGDVFIESGVNGLRIMTGVSLQRWKVNVEAPAYYYNDFAPGAKLGLRVGLEYGINKNFSAALTLQAVELGSKELAGTNGTIAQGVNPSWMQLGIRYSF